jgi:sugar phosphate isomerase/epimerase
VPYQLGVAEVVFGSMDRLEASHRALELGFSHIDVAGDDDRALALPVVNRAWPRPRPGFSTGAPPDAPGTWERAVKAYRREAGAMIEPLPGSIVGSVERVVAFLNEAPGTGLLLDTGHVATWGEDPAALAPFATHVQLRQARKEVPQTTEGDVDFDDFLGALRRAGYEGALSIEYFDLPDLGFPLEDPLGHALRLAEEVRPLL